MPDDPELIDVRADERLDLARLDPFLRDRLPNAAGPLRMRQFGGGHANLTYLLRFREAEYVLRRPPLGPVAPTSHDMKREHRVLANLWRVFPLAPRSYLLCDDPTIIGADFHVMERRHGIVIRRDLPARFEGNPALNRRIGEMIVDVLARLHAADPEAADLGDLGRPEGFVERQLQGWAKRWHAAKDRDLPRVDEIAAWLERNLPTAQATALLHNDFKLDNMMVEPE
ncbi:MAG: phosphotransferase family protein, partial [Kiloniellaceae bacterium]